MHEYIKKRIVKDLIDEIASLDPRDLELVGHNVINVLEENKMIHKGINKDYKPVGYTVDSFSHDSSVVGEYSTEMNYFESSHKKKGKDSTSFQKIENDINHANEHCSPEGPEKIYLITNQEEPPSFRAKFNQTKLGQIQGSKITFMDARELAKAVYEQSTTKPEYADFYKQFFPRFALDLDNYEYYGKLPPPCSGHVQAKQVTSAIKQHFESQNICVLFGISGSGKTEAANDFVRSESDSFENYIWISGEDWKRDTPLSSVQRTRGGAPVNVAGLFNRGKCILVIDSLERTIDSTWFDELKHGSENGSIVLITSQVAIPGDPRYLAIPELPIEIAAQILGEDFDAASPIAKQFIDRCKISPLILSVARATIAQGGFPAEDLYQELLDSPETVTHNGESIIRKILDRLDNETREALRAIANSGISSHDLRFLRHFIGINNCRKLQQLSILVPTSVPDIVKVHDLVCQAVSSERNVAPLAEKIESYIDKHHGNMTPSVLRQIYLARQQLREEHEMRGPRSPDWLTYSLLQIEGVEKKSICDQLSGSDISKNSALVEVMCVVDANEAYAYAIEDLDKRQAFLSQCARQYDEALHESCPDEIRVELLHHRGKTLRRTGECREAMECFAKLLELGVDWPATHLQITSLSLQKDADSQIKSAGEKSMNILVDAILEDSSAVPLRVSLATLARLRSFRDIGKKISDDVSKVKMLADVIAMAGLEGLDQFFEAFVSFTSIFSYHHSECCVDLAEKLSDMLALPPSVVDNKQWVSACEALANTSIAAGREGKECLAQQLISAAVRFADAIDQEASLKSYTARAIAKTYIQAEMPEKALDAISKVEGEQIDHWLLYRKAETERLLGNSEAALRTAQEAFSLAKSDYKARKHISSYHDLLSKCYENVELPDEALTEARNALAECTDEKYSKVLSARVDTLRRSME